MNKTAIIIPYYQGEKFISSCLQSILEESSASRNDVKVFILDNDPNGFKLETYSSQIEHVRLQPALGFVRAVNFGVYRAFIEGFTSFVVLNQDTKFLDKGLSVLLESINKKPGALLSPMIYSYDGKEIHQVFQRYLTKYRKLGENQFSLLPAVCFAFDRSLLKSNLLFDPVFHHYGEDHDFMLRKKLGGELIEEAKLAHFAALNEREEDKSISRDFNYLKGLVILNRRYKNDGSLLNMHLAHLRFFLLKRKNPIYALRYISFVLKGLFDFKSIHAFDRNSVMNRTIQTLKQDGFKNPYELRDLLNA